MTFKEAITKYIENQCKSDEAFAAKVPTQDKKQFDKAIDMDCRYCISCAQKMKEGNCAVIDDATVYKWARDYFNDGMYEQELEGKKVTPNIKGTVEVAYDEDLNDFATAKKQAEKLEKTRETSKACKKSKEIVKKEEKEINKSFEQLSLFDM